MSKVLAFDFGGSSYRAIIGEIVNCKLSYKEIARYENKILNIDGHMHWDFNKICSDIKEALKIATNYGFDSIGIDTWGVDYGLLDENDKLINTPYHYRDSRTRIGAEKIDGILSQSELYNESGIQPLDINTVCQLMSESEDIMRRAHTILFMPDLLSFVLTGKKRNEYTIASTSGLLDVAKCEWNHNLIEKLGLKHSLFQEIVQPTEAYGKLSKEIADELGISQVPIFAVCSHDTASAIFTVPNEENSAYVSCGTWSLMGVNSTTVNCNDEYFTNEGGYGGEITYLRNIMGLWLIQETKRIVNLTDAQIKFSDLDNMVGLATLTDSVIDPNATEFVAPENMCKSISEYCRDTHQNIPTELGQIVEIIYKSLAMSYKYTLEKLRTNLGRNINKLYIIGGGSKSALLCQMAADITGIEIVAGANEATAIGNILAQFIALGDIDECAIKSILSNLDGYVIYKPNQSDYYDKQYQKFISLNKNR